jgi:hypothetical protein
VGACRRVLGQVKSNEAMGGSLCLEQAGAQHSQPSTPEDRTLPMIGKPTPQSALSLPGIMDGLLNCSRAGQSSSSCRLLRLPGPLFKLPHDI